MNGASFEKVSRSAKRLYGPRKLLLCGFPADAQPKYGTVLKIADLVDLPVVWVGSSQAGARLADLLELPSGAGGGEPSGLPRTLIVSGITEDELHRLMAVTRKTGMAQAMWAVLTPTSENWTVQELLTELSAEREAMQKRKTET